MEKETKSNITKPKKPKKQKLTLRTKMFIKEYPVDLIGGKAAIRAGYSAKTADQMASRLLRNVKIQEEIQKEIKKRTEATQATAEDVLKELSGILKVNMLDFCTIGKDGCPYVDLSGITREQGALIQSVDVDQYIEEDGEDGKTVKKVKVKFWDKMKAADLLGKYHKLFIDRIEHTGKDGEPIQYKDTSNLSIEELAALIAQERDE